MLHHGTAKLRIQIRDIGGEGREERGFIIFFPFVEMFIIYHHI